MVIKVILVSRCMEPDVLFSTEFYEIRLFISTAAIPCWGRIHI